MGTLADDLAEIIDEMNMRIEELITEKEDSGLAELAIVRLREKVNEFVYELELELDKLDDSEMRVEV